jgi:hypothetical protein
MGERRIAPVMHSEIGYEALYVAMAAEWAAITARPAPDGAAFRAIRAEAEAIKRAGKWVSGPADLLTILGRHRDELFHSRMLGWLMSPSGRHGLGDRFLRAFLAEALPEVSADTRGARVSLEVTRSAPHGVTGETMEARADLVLETESLVVVIENKVDAGEQWNQCERLYWPWACDPIETHWVFLTPSSREPITATSDEARAAWRSISYAQVRDVLARTLADAPAHGAGLGRASVHQYLETLAAHYR